MTRVLLVVVAAALLTFAFVHFREGRGAVPPAPEPGARQSTKPYLTDEQRLKLFDLERADVLLGRALSPWLDALGAGRGDDIAAALQSSFEARVPPLTGLTLEANGRPFGLAAAAGETRLDTAGFVAWIETLRAHFDETCTFSFGRKFNSALILDPEAMAESHGAFRIAGSLRGGGQLEVSGDFTLEHRGLASGNLPKRDWIGALTLTKVRFVAARRPFFEDVTAHSGIDVGALHDNWKSLGEPDGYYTHPGGVFLGDVDADGHLDVILTDRGRTWLYLGDGSGRFAPTPWSPPTPKSEVSYAAIFDATGDGRVEVLHNGVLYRMNESRHMAPVAGATRLPRGDMALCDYDRDGLTDVYVLESGPRAPGSRTPAFFDDDRISGHANQLFRNLGGGQFEDVTAKTNAAGGHGRTFAAVWFYANDDRLPDLLAVNEFGRNILLLQTPSGRFEEGSAEGDAFGGYSMGAAAGDLDGDGKVDAYVSNMYSKAGHRVFHHLPLEIYPESVRSMFRTSVEGNKYYKSRGDGTFADRSLEAGINVAGWGWSGAILDVDLDGWLDVYAPCGHRSENKDIPDG